MKNLIFLQFLNFSVSQLFHNCISAGIDILYILFFIIIIFFFYQQTCSTVTTTITKIKKGIVNACWVVHKMISVFHQGICILTELTEFGLHVSGNMLSKTAQKFIFILAKL